MKHIQFSIIALLFVSLIFTQNIATNGTKLHLPISNETSDSGKILINKIIHVEGVEKGIERLKECTSLDRNGDYETPNVYITDGTFHFQSQKNRATLIMTSVSGGIRTYKNTGRKKIPNGEYIMSLKSTSKNRPLEACIIYNN